MAPRVLIVSNRLPVTARRSELGFAIEPSSGGLATGLRAAHEQTQGWWIGWPGVEDDLGPEERENLRELLVPRRYAPVHLSRDELTRYYHGFSNEFLWPVFHYLTGQVPYRTRDWPVYQDVNRCFAEEVIRHY